MLRNLSKSCPMVLTSSTGDTGVEPVLERYEAALLMVLGFGGFSLLLAFVHNAVRKHVFHDVDNLDTTFDAGGNVSLSLTAVTVASQMVWPGDFLHSATLAARHGIASPFWFAVGIVVNIFIFPIFSVQFKTRAPGAKTYLQVMRARFGRNTHIVFCCFALIVNLCITVSILLAGRATIGSLVKDTSDEFTLCVMAVLFGSYCLIGGLGTTFYVSYFNACLVFILLIVFVVKIWHSTNDDHVNVGSTKSMSDTLSCLKGPDENFDSSFITFRSGVGLLYGLIELFVASAFTYCDQASWQSRIAAKPLQGVYGFLLGGIIWFAIPTTMATTSGLAYLSFSAENGTHLLTQNQIYQGLVTPLVAETMLGSIGGTLLMSMIAMALMSTGSGEVMAVSSIIVYDIYQTYIRPFRSDMCPEDCILCGKRKKEFVKKLNNDDVKRARDVCECLDIINCRPCEEDTQTRHVKKASLWNSLKSNVNSDYNGLCTKGKSNVFKPPMYKCPIHGAYRAYQDRLIDVKNWCILLVTIAIVPLGMIVFETGITLAWLISSGAVVTIHCFPAVILSIVWVKATGSGLISGGFAGLICGVAANLIVSSTYEGGLGHFLENTSQSYSILAGAICSFGTSLTGCIIVSLFTHNIKSTDDENYEWQKTYSIENPLNPWAPNYREELKGFQYDGKPTFNQMSQAFRKARLVAYVGGAVCIAVFVLIVPGIMAIFPVMDLQQFSFWIWGTQVYAILMGVIVVIAPLLEEIYQVRKAYKKTRNREKNNYYRVETKTLDLIGEDKSSEDKSSTEHELLPVSLVNI